MIYTEHEYLAHHGVDKQKWGHRNGPPYPLNPEQMTSAQKRANADEGWFKRKIREAREKKEARKAEKKLEKQAHKEGRLTEKERKEVYNNADLKKAYEHRSEFSNRDIESILNRYDMQQQLSQKVSNLEYKEKMRNKEKMDIAARYVESAVNIGRKAIDIYNIAAAVGNAFGEKEWKPIRIGEFKRKDNNNSEGLSNEEKYKLINSGDLNKVNKYKDQLSSKELQNAMDKKKANDKLKKMLNGEEENNNNNKKNNKKNNYYNNNKKQDDYYDNKKQYNYDTQKPKSWEVKDTKSYKPKTESTNKKNSYSPSTNIKSQKVTSDSVKSNAKKGENWLFSSGLGYSLGYSGSNYKNTFDSNVKLDYSNNHVKDNSGNTYRMISTGGKISDIDSNYINNGVDWIQSTGWSIDWNKK